MQTSVRISIDRWLGATVCPAASSVVPNQVITTQFTLLTWLPVSLFRQFKVLANFYFAVICGLVLTDWSPVSWTSVVPAFIFVLGWAVLTDLFEDLRRKRDDDAENYRECWRFDHEHQAFERTQWLVVKCGDLLWLPRHERFPADLVLVHTHPEPPAFISTANLDGETNWKERFVPAICAKAPLGGTDSSAGGSRRSRTRTSTGLPREKRASDAEIGDSLRAGALVATKLLADGISLQLGPPTADLSDLSGSCGTGGEECPLDGDQLLPRGCVLQNPNWALGIVAYVGAETKTRLNSGAEAPHKVSDIQHLTNRFVAAVIAMVFIIGCIGAAIGHGHPLALGPASEPAPLTGHGEFLIRACVYIIIFYQCVPISMYLALSILKSCLCSMINADPEMTCEETGGSALARTASIVEELGQVEYIFSDKTGTLTRNEMRLARCFFTGCDPGDFRADHCNGALGSVATGVLSVRQALWNSSNTPEAASPVCGQDARHFFLCLALCHAVDVKIQEGSPHYASMSPDEIALVEAADQVGITLAGRRRTGQAWELELNLDEVRRMYTVLEVIAFNSDRKRMSVVCRSEAPDELLCITKGADNIMRPLLEAPLGKAEEINLESYSHMGLRTLVVASRRLTADFVSAWQDEIRHAQKILDKAERNEGLERAYARMETGLQLAGITALEDRLQEGVAQAIMTVKAAGMRFWVLTGDKTETAMEIARSCGILSEGMTVARVADAANEEGAMVSLKAARSLLRSDSSNGALVLEGSAVRFALMSPEGRQLIFELAEVARACVCCRLSPEQKQRLVEVVREWSPKAITLAIGDGANDVPMIRAAHVGVGVRGKEGNQSVQASDFAISQFRFLTPLLLGHGRQASIRTATFLCYFLYKHMSLAMGDFIWAGQTGFTGEKAYLEWPMTTYNFASSLPVMLCLSVSCTQDLPNVVACSHPELYSAGPARLNFNAAVWAEWALLAMWHGGVAWVATTSMRRPGEADAFWAASTVSIVLVTLHGMLRLMAIFSPKVSTVGKGLILFAAVMGEAGYITSIIVIGQLHTLQPELAGRPIRFLTEGHAPACLALSPFVAMIPDVALFALRSGPAWGPFAPARATGTPSRGGVAGAVEPSARELELQDRAFLDTPHGLSRMA